MLKFAKADKESRAEVFVNAGTELDINPAIVEKDFWVCYVLDYLFHRSKWKNAFVFKGGTSLSKAYKAIERFSEDVDLIMDWRLIDYTDDQAWEERSKTQQDKYGKQMVKDAANFLKDVFRPELQEGLRSELGESISVEMDEGDKDGCTVNVYYEHAFQDSYLRPEIRLEIGPLAEWTPSHERIIESFVAEIYPIAFDTTHTAVTTVDAERTFWEKALILHKTAYSCEEKGIPLRYARHYYDLYCLDKAGLKDSAFEQIDLLERDVIFKSKFYYAKNARYDMAKPGTILLVPRSDEAIEILADDYENMRLMIYGEAPEFNEIIDRLREIESEINAM